MGTIKDLTGQKFDYLTVIKDSGKRRADRSVLWECQCICGTICYRTSSNLKSSSLHSCGCRQRENININNLCGKRFGKLTVIERDYNYAKQNNKKSIGYWKCQCDCGVTITVSTTHLTSGSTKSCGCLAKEKNIQNRIGKKYGHLIVLELDENNTLKHQKDNYWKCKCDCGQIITVNSHNLTNEITTSCGCINMSKGEDKIFQILKENNINFLYDTEYFKDLYLYKNRLGRYDFILLNENNIPYRLIEFDGELHYQESRFKNSHNTLEERQQYDNIKNEYAKIHNLPLVRIPYWERKNITLEMIMGDKYLVI